MPSIVSQFRSAGYKFPYRHPPANGIIEKTLVAVGGLLRGLGGALDEIGSIVQGPNAMRETVQPNLAWAPTKPEEGRTPQAGAQVTVPPVTRIPPLKQVVMPVKSDNVFVAPSANVLGDVKIGSGSSIWYGAVLRGDVNSIFVGDNTNIQDNVTVHVARHAIGGQPKPTVIGSNVTVGHGATIHAATIKDNVLLGMGSTVLDGAEVGEGAIVAAGAIVAPGTAIPAKQVWAGAPARFLRDVLPEESAFVAASANNYNKLAAQHKFECGKSFEELSCESAIERERDLAADPTNSVHQMWVFDRQTMLAVSPKK